MKTSRERMLDYINSQHSVTIAELAGSLHTSEANVRHHLAILMDSGLVQVTGERRPIGKGRPTRLFGPASHILGSGVDALAEALLVEIGKLLPRDQHKVLLEQAARQIARSIGLPENPQPGTTRVTPPTAQRLTDIARQLSEHHYRARWEARPDSPRMILGHCPFSTIIDAHPELCILDAHLLAALTGSPVEQTARLLDDGRGGHYCSFRLQF